MADQSLRLAPVAPLSNEIRTRGGRPTDQRIAEALDTLQRSLQAVAARLPQNDGIVTDLTFATRLAAPDRS